MRTLPVFVIFGFFASLASGQTPPQPRPVEPGAALSISGKLLNEIVDRPVDRVEPVREVILDAEVFGMGRTKGKISVQLYAKAEYALFEMVFQGQSCSSTVGYDEPIKAYSESVITFDVRKTIGIDQRGVHGYPSRARAHACTRLVGMTNYQGEVEVTSVDLGKRRHALEKPQIEAESARKAECKLVRSFDRDMTEPIDKMNQLLVEAKTQFAKVGLPLRALNWSTTTSHLNALAFPAGVSPTTKPPEVPEACDVAVRLHQEAFAEIARNHLAHRTTTLFELAGVGEKALGPLLGDGKVSSLIEQVAPLLKLLGIETLYISFAERPVSLEFTDNHFTLTLHASNFKSGKNAYAGRDVRAKYKIEKTDEGFAAVRQGAVEIVAPRALPSAAELQDDQATRTLLQSTFNFFFLDRLKLGEATLPYENKSLTLVPHRIDARDGWLQLCWLWKTPAKK